MAKGILKNTVLESGVVSEFIRASNVRFETSTNDMIYDLEYYLNQETFEQGFKPLAISEFRLDSGFVKQYEATRKLLIENVMYSLLNSSIDGAVNI